MSDISVVFKSAKWEEYIAEPSNNGLRNTAWEDLELVQVNLKMEMRLSNIYLFIFIYYRQLRIHKKVFSSQASAV